MGWKCPEKALADPTSLRPQQARFPPQPGLDAWCSPLPKEDCMWRPLGPHLRMVFGYRSSLCLPSKIPPRPERRWWSQPPRPRPGRGEMDRHSRRRGEGGSLPAGGERRPEQRPQLFSTHLRRTCPRTDRVHWGSAPWVKHCPLPKLFQRMATAGGPTGLSAVIPGQCWRLQSWQEGAGTEPGARAPLPGSWASS